jgi:hypothetical protein
VARGEDQVRELLHLSVRCRRTSLLTKRHDCIVAGGCDLSPDTPGLRALSVRRGLIDPEVVR